MTINRPVATIAPSADDRVETASTLQALYRLYHLAPALLGNNFITSATIVISMRLRIASYLAEELLPGDVTVRFWDGWQRKSNVCNGMTISLRPKF